MPKGAPLVPGADGVGLLEDGTRVYFAFTRAPIGAMAETVAGDALCCVAIPIISITSPPLRSLTRGCPLGRRCRRVLDSSRASVF